MNKLKTLLLLFPILCFGMEAFAYDVYVDGIYYNFGRNYNEASVTSGGTIYNGNVTIPSSFDYNGETYNVTSIGDYAFSGCGSLTSVTIPNSVTTIGESAFSFCSRLETINVDEANVKYTSVDGVLYTKDKSMLLQCPGKRAGGFVIPNSVTTIGESAFYRCSNLTSITIPNSVTTIGDGAFNRCSSLTSVTIPNSVTTIGETAFSFCSRLETINVDEANVKYTSVDGVLYTKDKSMLLQCPGKRAGGFVIPNSVTTIGNYAFHGCSNLTSITIPNSVTTIGDGAFSGCSNLTSVTIPNSVTTIEGDAFFGCSNLTSVTIPNSVTTIGNYAFHSCSNLTSVTIPNSVTTIGNYAFADCSSLASVILRNRHRLSGYNSFNGINPKCVLYVPAGVKEWYEDKYKQYFSTIEPIYIVIESVECKGTPTPTGFLSIKGRCTETEEFGSVVETGFEGYGVGDSIFVRSLEPGMANDVVFYAVTDDGYREEKTFTVTTPALELTTLQPRCVSSSCAIVAATTNISEEETNVGFQWKKYDAPESLKPSEGYSAIYDGRLEGYIRNLQSTSYYNVRAFYKSAAGNYHYGDWVTFDPSDFSYFEPTVHTYAAESVTASSARVKGYVLAGTEEITGQGFEYRPQGTDAGRSRSVRAAKAESAPDGVQTVFATGQVMTAELCDLRPGTTYCLRAFVETASGKTYGEEQTFTTSELASGISEAGTGAAAPAVESYYDLNGRKLGAPQRGINIIRYTDGTTRKVIVR